MGSLSLFVYFFWFSSVQLGQSWWDFPLLLFVVLMGFSCRDSVIYLRVRVACLVEYVFDECLGCLYVPVTCCIWHLCSL